MAALKKISKRSKPTINPEDDVTESSSPMDLAKVSEICGRAATLEMRIARGQELLGQLQDELNDLLTKTLPDTMDSFGLKEFKLKDGAQVTIKQIIAASLPTMSAIEKERDKDKQATMRHRFEAAMDFLKANKASALIKTTVKAELGKDSEKVAKAVAAALKELGVQAAIGKAVNANTLSAWIKERLEAGLPVDYDLFGVFDGRKAIIKPTKPNNNRVI